MKEGNTTILIVDDIASNIYALENLLAKDDRIFLTATSGSEGLKIALGTNLDLIILDVQMPDMDGFEVANMLKSNKRTKDIPILFASAEMKEQKNIVKGLEEGAIDYLFKPLDPEVTRAKVNVLLKLELQRKELIEKNSALEKSFILINNCCDIICTIDAESMRFEEYNTATCTLLGYTPGEMDANPLTFFLASDDIENIENLRRSRKDTLSFETRMYCKDRSSKWLQWNIAVKGSKWFCNARDITDRKLADEEIKHLNQNLKENVQQLEMANRELESFSYSVSHDLRSPLRALSMYSQIIEDEHLPGLSPEAQKMFANIKRNTHRMGRLIDDLLEFSRLGKKTVKKNVINMKNLIESVYNELETPYKKGVLILDELPEIEADYNLLKQVVINLISNAVKYSSKIENASVHVGFLDKEDEVIYFVKDNGVGFDMEYLNKLFGVFQRLHSEKEFEGTGVGLAIVSRIVEKHGGRVWAEAKVNEGATFYFSLPKTISIDLESQYQ
jgi:PAS domain S-box-containing protein